MVWKRSHYQDGSRTSLPVEIYLFSGYFIKKNVGERDQKQLKAITVTSSVSMQSVSSVRYNWLSTSTGDNHNSAFRWMSPLKKTSK